MKSHFRTMFLLGAAVFTCISGQHLILDPPSSTKGGSPVAIIWIHGMQCEPEAYKTFALEVQQAGINTGGGNDLEIWVGIPKFVFDVPEPILIAKYIDETLNELKDKKHGFPEGAPVFLAAHSLGGVMSQIYLEGSKHDQIQGLMLMGSVLLRKTRSISATGTTLFNFTTPTLTMQGTKDGLLRVSRGAESYWHSMTNIDPSQANNYPVIAFEGFSHSSWMDASMLPKAVTDKDLKPEVDEITAHKSGAAVMVAFMRNTTGQPTNTDLHKLVRSSEDIFAPLINAMILEGSYNLKEPCYNKTLVNEVSPTCLQGNKWSERAQ